MNKIYSLFVRFLVVLLAFQGSVAALLINTQGAQASAAPGVIINEIMWMGTSASSSDEWIELRNTTASPVDIGGWQLTNSSSELTEILTIPTGATIVANGFYLISRFDAANSELAVEPDFLANVAGNQLQIDDSCDAGTTTFVRLENPFPTDPPTVIDQSGCDSVGGNPLAGVDGVTKKAMERNLVVANGLLSSSWHDSMLQINLDLPAVDFASPSSINDDLTPPNGGIVNDGVAADIDWSAQTDGITINWSDFVDFESSVASYEVGLGTTTASPDFIGFTNVGDVTSHLFTFPVEVSGGTYYSFVRAINGVGLTGAQQVSDGFTIDIANPATPTGLSITDVPSDNGGSIKATWDASTSVDEITYQLNYRKTGEISWIPINSGAALEAVVTGLDNAVDYDFTVEAIDFNSQHSAVSSTVIGQALDNLAPIIDPLKVVIAQNKPGTVDTVTGLVGASNEPSVTVTLLTAEPGNPAATVINSVASLADGSWPALGIGDNIYPAVWLQLKDASGNLSTALKILNDISGPVAPVLNQVVSSCPGESCQVTLNWTAGSSDTASYKVNYIVDGVESSTFELSATSLVLVLPAGKSYSFTVTGFDQYGNASLKSNSVNVALTKGVVSTVNSGGTTTTAISGSTEVISSDVENSTPAQFIPKAKAIDTSGDSVPKEEEKPLVQGSDNSRDWIRIFVVVILLLIIAGSFYALSRSVQETPEEEYDKKIVAAKSQKSKKRLAKRRHRRR